jgi:hypothetical protein
VYTAFIFLHDVIERREMREKRNISIISKPVLAIFGNKYKDNR